VIIDTDLSLWWDDATALGMANVLHNRHEIRVLGVVSDVPNDVAVTAIDAVNTAYGNPEIAVGALADSSSDSFPHGYTDALIDALPHSGRLSGDVPEAVQLFRELLSSESDQSVTIVAIGGYTNLAGLLASGPDDLSDRTGRALIAARVDRLVIMDGLFPDGGPPLTNQEIDSDAAKTVVEGDWPTPIAWVDGFSGIATLVGSDLCADVSANHPMRIVYEELFGCEPPGDGNWDAPTLLYAIGDLDEAFEEHGQGGAAVMNDAGGLSWDPESPRVDDVYVRVVDQESLNDRVDELLTAG
jgi:inosine-uridine nucleoside N-ribohydrolase